MTSHFSRASNPSVFQPGSASRMIWLPARPDFVVVPQGKRSCAADVQIGDGATVMIGYDDVMAELSQDARFFQDAHMAAIVREQAGRREHWDAIVALMHSHE